jgi:hypothetical protein
MFALIEATKSNLAPFGFAQGRLSTPLPLVEGRAG